MTGREKKTSELATEVAQNVWKTKTLPVEVGCIGFLPTSTTSLLKKIGVREHCLSTSNQFLVKRSRKYWQMALH